MKYIGLQKQIRINNFRSLVLMILFPIITMANLLFILTLYSYSESRHQRRDYYGNIVDLKWEIPWDSYPAQFAEYMPFVLLAAFVWFLYCIADSENIIENIYLSCVDKPGISSVGMDAPPRVRKMFENLCVAAGMPAPKLRVTNLNMMNAYASGFSRQTYTVTITDSMLNGLTRKELKTVLAHELSHIRNRDTFLMMTGTVFSGIYMMVIAFCLAIGILAGFRSALGLAAVLLSLFLTVLMSPGILLTWIAQMMFSHKREYLADAGAVELTADTMSLISALRKTEKHNSDVPMLGCGALMFSRPIKKYAGLRNIFSTHPTLESRIEFLRGIACQLESPQTH